MNQDASREIFPVTIEGQSEVLLDFRAIPVPADALLDEEERLDPKGESALEPVISSVSPKEIEEKGGANPARPPAARVTTPPKGSKNG